MTFKGRLLHVERSCSALDDLLRDHDLVDAFEAWHVEHSVKEHSLHDRAQTPRTRLAVDRCSSQKDRLTCDQQSDQR